ncbi:MAG: hypothetical protein K9N05_00955 [Candidatus Marinimicrobia bacterium]|nr:hypothetical protein [Candidatus Neomarinimicrobiota bacterium]
MEKKPFSLAWYIIGSAIIWGIVILLCALLLKSDYLKVQLILGSGAAIHLIVIWLPLAARFGKSKKKNE